MPRSTRHGDGALAAAAAPVFRCGWAPWGAGGGKPPLLPADRVQMPWLWRLWRGR